MDEHEGGSHLHAHFRQGLPPPDGPSPLGWRGYGTCVFCQSGDTVWQHDLNQSLADFRTVHGSGSTWSTALHLCQRCEDLYNQGDYSALARLEKVQPWHEDDTIEGLLVGIAAVCRADRGPRLLAVPEFPAGFEPWDQYTGADWMFDLWPEPHRVSVAETRRPQLDDDPDAQIQLLASPWPSLNLREALGVLFRWAEQDWDREATADPYPGRVSEAFAWTDEQAKEFLDKQVEQPPSE